jgi:hypothetical protein
MPKDFASGIAGDPYAVEFRRGLPLPSSVRKSRRRERLIRGLSQQHTSFLVTHL